MTNLKVDLDASGSNGAPDHRDRDRREPAEIATGAGNMSIADSTANGSVIVNAAALASRSTLTLKGSRPETVLNFSTGALDASGLTAASLLTLTASGTGPRTLTTGPAAANVADNATGAFTINAGTGPLTLTGAADSTTVDTGAGNATIVDNATGALTVDASATAAGRSLTLSGSGDVTVTNLAENVAASALNGNLTVTTKTTSLSIATGAGANTIAQAWPQVRSWTLTGSTAATVNGRTGNLTATSESAP